MKQLKLIIAIVLCSTFVSNPAFSFTGRCSKSREMRATAYFQERGFLSFNSCLERVYEPLEWFYDDNEDSFLDEYVPLFTEYISKLPVLRKRNHLAHILVSYPREIREECIKPVQHAVLTLQKESRKELLQNLIDFIEDYNEWHPHPHREVMGDD